ncbi:MAG: DNA repair protein RadC [Bacteroidetes bacterium]|nr:DNA repair protein RadC [Bacteroidota bacterium]
MSEPTNHHLSIKNWAEEDRPREKLLLKGKAALSDAELLAILLRTGVKGTSALDMSKAILNKVQGDLNELGKLSVSDLKKMQRGLGDTKSITLVAALELGRRRQATEVREKPQIRCSRDIFDFIYPDMADLKHEEFFVLFLNKANRVLAHRHISKGGVDGTVADIKIILRHALELLSSGIVAVHNHPSGNLKPSEADIRLTRKLKESAALMDIQLLDHLIIGEQRYFSFSDEGML